MTTWSSKDLPDVKVYFGRWWFLPSRFRAVTLPPIGVFVSARKWNLLEYEDRTRLIRHEAVHWEQYQRWGLVGVYIRYVLGWLRHGYKNHPHEIEARERA